MKHVHEPIRRDDAVEEYLAHRARGCPFYEIEDRCDVGAREHLRENPLDVWSDGRDLEGQLEQALGVSASGAAAFALRRMPRDGVESRRIVVRVRVGEIP